MMKRLTLLGIFFVVIVGMLGAASIVSGEETQKSSVPFSPVSYKIRDGDTLYKIARGFGARTLKEMRTFVGQTMLLNPCIRDPDLIYAEGECNKITVPFVTTKEFLSVVVNQKIKIEQLNAGLEKEKANRVALEKELSTTKTELKDAGKTLEEEREIIFAYQGKLSSAEKDKLIIALVLVFAIVISLAIIIYMLSLKDKAKNTEKDLGLKLGLKIENLKSEKATAVERISDLQKTVEAYRNLNSMQFEEKERLKKEGADLKLKNADLARLSPEDFAKAVITALRSLPDEEKLAKIAHLLNYEVKKDEAGNPILFKNLPRYHERKNS